jgi:hypothetical protein
LRYCYTLFDKVDHTDFLEQLLKAYKEYPLEEQLQKLEILEKITFRQV